MAVGSELVKMYLLLYGNLTNLTLFLLLLLELIYYTRKMLVFYTQLNLIIAHICNTFLICILDFHYLQPKTIISSASGY